MGDTSPGISQNIITTFTTYVSAGMQRLRASALSIVQNGLGTGIAYFVAQHVTHHNDPFFAPMATVIVLGMGGSNRLRRSLELVVGVTLGVALGDLVVSIIGADMWQLGLIVAASLVVARFVDEGQLVATQAAIGSVLVATILPPGDAGTWDRSLDALIGGAVALLMTALLPSRPLRTSRRALSIVLGIVADVLVDVDHALTTRDPRAMAECLAHIRSTQGNVNSMIAAVESSREYTRVSPLLWGRKNNLRSVERALQQVDNAVRTTRVLARRARVLLEDGDTVSAEQCAIIGELASITRALSDLYAGRPSTHDADHVHDIVRRLRLLGSRVGADVARDGVMTAVVILAQTRSLIVDLLQVCGLSRESALAVLQPTTAHPRVPPEIWNPDTREPATFSDAPPAYHEDADKKSHDQKGASEIGHPQRPED